MKKHYTPFIANPSYRRRPSGNRRALAPGVSADGTPGRDDHAGANSALEHSIITTIIPSDERQLRAAATDSTASQSKQSLTKHLPGDSPNTKSILASLLWSGFKIGEAAAYTRLPVSRHITDIMLDVPCWRIELHGLGPGIGPIGIDVVGDVLIGRGPEADLDIIPYQGYEKAVSRRHAMLRPSKHQLYLIDLNSTNGTFLNTVPVARNSACPLEHDDVITLGLLTFTIKIIDGPVARQALAKEFIWLFPERQLSVSSKPAAPPE